MSDLKDYKYDKKYFDRLYVKYWDKFEGDIKKVSNKISELKQKVVAKILFSDILTNIKNKKDGQKNIIYFLVTDTNNLDSSIYSTTNSTLSKKDTITSTKYNKTIDKKSTDKIIKYKQKSIMNFIQ